MGKRLIAPVGQRYGRWTVLGNLGGCPSKWLCLCDCGKRVAVRSGYLRDGSSRSCGCLNVDLSKERGGNVVVAQAGLKAKQYDGTSISLISRSVNRPNCGNVTGVLGVSPQGKRFRACEASRCVWGPTIPSRKPPKHAGWAKINTSSRS